MGHSTFTQKKMPQKRRKLFSRYVYGGTSPNRCPRGGGRLFPVAFMYDIYVINSFVRGTLSRGFGCDHVCSFTARYVDNGERGCQQTSEGMPLERKDLAEGLLFRKLTVQLWHPPRQNCRYIERSQKRDRSGVAPVR